MAANYEQALLDKLDENYDQIKSFFLEGPYTSENMCLESAFHINITTPPKFDWVYKDNDQEMNAFVVIWVRSCEMKQIVTVNNTSVVATEMMLPRSDIFTLSLIATNTSSGVRVSLTQMLSNNNDVKKLVVQALGIPWLNSSDEYYRLKKAIENSILIN